MLPTIALLAVYCVSIVVSVVADTLDREILLDHGLDDRRRIDQGVWRWGNNGRLDQSRVLRVGREAPFCHNLIRASKWL